MVSRKFQNLWKLMLNHNFEIAECNHENIICNICHRIMIEPYITECGCQFCEQCILNYMNNGKKNCPGLKEFCLSTLLDMHVSIVRDYGLCHKIANTVVVCPNEVCNFKSNLDKMEEHLKVCNSSRKHIPYQTVGTEQTNLAGDSLNSNIQSDISSHSKINMKVLKKLQNDIDELKLLHKKKSKKIKTEIFLLKGLLRELRSDNEKCQLEVEFQKLKETIQRNERELKELRKDFNMQNECENSSEMGLQHERNESLANDGLVTDTNSTEEGTSQVFQIKSEPESGPLREEWRDREARVKVELSGVMVEMESFKRTLARMSSVVLKMAHTFVWTIGDVSRDPGWRDSEPFYKDNYKLRLRVLIGRCYLRTHICIMKGDDDDQLQWPMRHTITLSVINEESMEEYASQRFDCNSYEGDQAAFDRPTDHRNSEIGGPCLYLKDGHVRASLSGDSVIICCSLVCRDNS